MLWASKRVAFWCRIYYTEQRNGGIALGQQKYRFDQEGVSVKADALAHLLPSERAAVTEYITYIRQHFPGRVLGVMLFGSKARGDADAESDVDLLVLVDEESNEFRSQLWRIASDISLTHNVVLSARVFGRARWEETRRIQLPLYRAIVADGIPLTPEHIPA